MTLWRKAQACAELLSTDFTGRSPMWSRRIWGLDYFGTLGGCGLGDARMVCAGPERHSQEKECIEREPGN